MGLSTSKETLSKKSSSSLGVLGSFSKHSRIHQRFEYIEKEVVYLGCERNKLAKFDLEIFGRKLQMKLKYRKNEPSEEYKDTVVGKYQVFELTDSGPFGRTYRVQDISTRVYFYCLKVVECTQESQEKIAAAISLEMKNFSPKTQNVAKFKEVFVLPHNIEKKKVPCVCLVEEYVLGSSVEDLLEYCDEKNEILRGSDLMQWFIKLLESLAEIHEQKITHGDLRPGNLMLYFPPMGRSLKKCNVKLSGFSFTHCGIKTKEQIQHSWQKPKKTDLYLDILYCSPETLQGKKITTKSDVFSLGIIFMQIYMGFSTHKFFQEVVKLFHVIGKKPALKKDFLETMQVESAKGFSLRHADHLRKFLVFLHKRGIFWKMIIQKRARGKLENDKALEVIMEKMIQCDPDKRTSASDLLKDDLVVQTWMKLFSPKITKSTFDKIDTRAMLFVLAHITDEILLFDRCLDAIMATVDNYFNFFILNRGIDLLCTKLLMFRDRWTKSQICYKFFSLLVKLVQIDQKRVIRSISLSLRKFYLIDLLKKIVLNSNNVDTHFLVLILLKRCKTTVHLFKDIFLPLFLKYDADKNIIFFYMIQTISPLINDRSVITKVFNVNKDNNILFLRDSQFKKDPEIVEMMITRVLKRVEEILVHPNSEDEVNRNMLMLLFLLGEKKVRKKKRRPHLKIAPPADIELTLNKVTQGDHNSKIISQRTGKNSVLAFSADTNLVSFVETDKPICEDFEIDEDRKECVYAYYEMKILDGGINDNLIAGVTFACEERTVSYLWDSEGYVIKLDEKKQEVSKEKYIKLKCCTSDVVGIGVTSKGNFVVTQNNGLVRDFFKLSDLEEQEFEISPIVKICGQDYMKCQFVWDDFQFKFKREKREPKFVIDENLDLKMKIIDTLNIMRLKMGRKSEHSTAYELVNYAIKILAEEKLIIKDLSIINSWEKDNTFKRVSEEKKELFELEEEDDYEIKQEWGLF